MKSSVYPTRVKVMCKRGRCQVCKKKLKAYEGKMCSCEALLCMKHRYKSDHSCTKGLVLKLSKKIIPKKVDII